MEAAGFKTVIAVMIRAALGFDAEAGAAPAPPAPAPVGGEALSPHRGVPSSILRYAAHQTCYEIQYL
jgi:hypothetical protein